MSEYNAEERKILLKLASDAIAYGLDKQHLMPIILQDYPEHLHMVRACFVTLYIGNQLRGCIGSLKAHQPLVNDIVYNAHMAAFADPRFTPLTQKEFAKIKIDISVLSEPQPMQFSSEQDLLKQLRPNVDGLILSDKGQRGTFLPSVWEKLPTPELFLAQLKLKAGFNSDYWSDSLQVERYTTELIS